MNDSVRTALAAYRAELDAQTPAPERNWSAVVGKIEAGVQPLSVDLAPRRRGRVLAWGLGAAAAVLLGIWAWPHLRPAQPGGAELNTEAALEVAQDEADGRAAEAPERSVAPRERPPEPALPTADPELAEPLVDPPATAPSRDTSRRSPKSSPVVAEAKSIRRVQSALRDGNAKRALGLLRRHRARFSDGALADEASLLQADALCLAGRTEAALRSARAFVSEHPKSPLAARAKGICAPP